MIQGKNWFSSKKKKKKDMGHCFNRVTIRNGFPLIASLTCISHFLTRLVQQRGEEMKAAREASSMEKRAIKDDGWARMLHPSSDFWKGRNNNKDVTPALTKTTAGLKNIFLKKDPTSAFLHKGRVLERPNSISSPRRPALTAMVALPSGVRTADSVKHC